MGLRNTLSARGLQCHLNPERGENLNKQIFKSLNLSESSRRDEESLRTTYWNSG